MKQFPQALRFHVSPLPGTSPPYFSESRQLIVAYFAILIILYRSPTPLSPPSAASLVASSFIAKIFEELLARDELRHLGPVFAFYALCAGLSQLPAYRYPSLRSTAEYETTIIKLSLQELSKQWASSFGALYALNKVREEILQQSDFDGPLPTVSSDVASFFDDFSPELCRYWSLVTGQNRPSEPAEARDDQDHPTVNTANRLSTPGLQGPSGTNASMAEGIDPSFSMYYDQILAAVSPSMDFLGAGWDGSGFDWSGSWLLSDWEN